jgi:hypothetical protein
MTDKEFVLSIYPDAEIQIMVWHRDETLRRVVSEPTISGRWISSAFFEDDLAWESAAEEIRLLMLRKLES